MSEFADSINGYQIYDQPHEKVSTAATVLDANGALAHSSARALDTFTACGSSNIIMAVVTIFSVLVAAYLIHQLISLIKEGIKSNQELKGAIYDALDGKD